MSDTANIQNRHSKEKFQIHFGCYKNTIGRRGIKTFIDWFSVKLNDVPLVVNNRHKQFIYTTIIKKSFKPQNVYFL